MTDFKHPLEQVGLHTKAPIVADGELHRFHVEGDSNGTKNGWYVAYNDGLPVMKFGCWKRDISEKWCTKSQSSLSAAERAEYKRKMDAAHKARKAEERARRAKAREKASSIWSKATPAPDTHPYLIKKGVGNHGLRLYKDKLIIPLRDSAGTLHSLQFIDGEGNKRFLSGGRKQGCYYLIGEPQDCLCIAEGYATAASIYEATGYAVAVAFDAGNLMAVAQAIRTKFPEIEITLCADNDTETPGNPGLTKAKEAAVAVGGLLAVAGGAHD